MAEETTKAGPSSTAEQNGPSDTGQRQQRNRQRNRRRNNQKKDGEQPQGEQQQQQQQQQQQPQQQRPRTNRKPVAKPKPQNLDKLGKRTVEVNQLKRGFPGHSESDNGVAFALKMKPTDPEFPFDMEQLSFTLFVPKDYPTSAPYISVQNTDIPRGFSANVESGFRDLAVKGLNRVTLMNLTVQLDRRLEEFLSQEKQETLKVVRHRKTEPVKSQPQLQPQSAANKPQLKSNGLKLNPQKVFVPMNIKMERQRQVDQLKHRLKDSATLFNESEHGSTFSIFIMPPHSEILPQELTTGFKAMLNVPSDYGISPCKVTIPSVQDITARNIEENFESHSKSAKSWSLVALINYLSTQLENLMLSSHYTAPVEEEKLEEKEEEQGRNVDTEAKVEENGQEDEPKSEPKEPESSEPGAKPTEVEAEAEPEPEHGLTEMPPLDLRGTSMHLQNLELSRIGILECQTLHLMVQCTRCKTQNVLPNIISAPYGRDSKPVSVSCDQCRAILAASFRKDFMHQYNHRAGLLDFSHCVPMDLLPSSYTPTCEECSTSLPQPFKKMGQGKKNTANCRECHTKMTMSFDSCQFEVITEESMSAEKVKRLPSKPHQTSKLNEERQRLGITPGTALPKNGSCKHYRKSMRWLRFSCCGELHPCDKCHDDRAGHPNERAHRMVCGACSREQNFAQQCVYCKQAFETKHSGFWEGGTGQRNKHRLSRKDPRKHSRKGVSNSTIKANIIKNGGVPKK